ncbi:MAG: iron-sulfur cluster assembly scaffold protein [bacterium]|nr:iron-sulfur cluster assembly scaffold protein [bacterium]
MANIDALIAHYQRPKNWGSFPDGTERVLTGIDKVECYNDFLALQFKWAMLPCPECSGAGKVPNAASDSEDIEFVNCANCHEFGTRYYIEAVRHVSVGCGWLIAVASWFSEYAECRRVEEIMKLTVDDIINLSGLPWAGAHCASLVRGAIRDALDPGFSCLKD